MPWKIKMILEFGILLITASPYDTLRSWNFFLQNDEEKGKGIN